MANSAIQTSPTPSSTQVTTTPAQPASKAPERKQPQPWWHPLSMLRGLASLRLTVVLFLLGFFLVFFGTLAQRDLSTDRAVTDYFGSFVVWVPFQFFIQFVQTFPGILKSVHIPGSFPFPGGQTLGWMLMVNLLAAHAIRFKLTWKRAGIIVLHVGIILLLLGEWYRLTFAVENHLAFSEGEYVNYTHDLHKFELAVITTPDPAYDDELLIPGVLVRDQKTIAHEELPFDVEVVRYMPNSDLLTVPKGTAKHEVERDDLVRVDGPTNRMTGEESEYVIVEKPLVSGTDASGGRVDHPAAYVTLKAKGADEAMGTYMLSPLLKPQVVTVEGKTYELIFRFHRNYKPYTMHLIKTARINYPGTNTPKSYSSEVQLVDPTQHENRHAVIEMNEPLRYNNETFYQAGHDGASNSSTLQVVRNRFWIGPYVACTVVSLGMLIHFGLLLTSFLKKQRLAQAAPSND